MISDNSTVNPYGTPSTSGPAPTRWFQASLNKTVKFVFRVPGLGSVAGRRLLVFHVVGRKSVRRYEIPVSYTHHEGALLTGIPLRLWLNNIRKDVAVQVSTGRLPRTAAAQVFTDEATAMRLYEVIARDNHHHAKLNGIGFDAVGNPDKADIYQAWQLGGAVIRLALGGAR